MITLSESTRGLYACSFQVHDGVVHLFEYSEPYPNRCGMGQKRIQAAGFARRAEAHILLAAAHRGVSAAQALQGAFYPDLDVKRRTNRQA